MATGKQFLNRKLPEEYRTGIDQWWLITRDCCGIICAQFTMGLQFFAIFVQLKWVLGLRWPIMSWPCIFYIFLAALSIISHLRSQFTNPGCVPKNLLPSDNHIKWKRFVCRRTGIVKPKCSHYCSVIRQCVIRMDHYCPWVNNVVGMFTQKYFLLFITYTFLTCVFCAVTLVTRFLSCTRAQRFSPPFKNPLYCKPTTADFICSILNFVEAILFGLFTLIMGCDQMGAIRDNTPYIDRLKGDMGRKRPLYDNLKDVFGGDIGIRWFLPIGVVPEIVDNFQAVCRYVPVYVEKCWEDEQVTRQRREEQQRQRQMERQEVSPGVKASSPAHQS